MRKFYGLTYPEAVLKLLGGEQGTPYEPVRQQKQEEKKPFALPPASPTMRRLYAYLLQHRGISREVLDAFVHAKLIYESVEPSRDGSKVHHNAVFIGTDEHGVARHAHRRGLYTFGEGFKRNVTGCDPCYSFHHCGTSDRLYVFEAPIDLLSFLSIYPQDWQEHSYVSLCGTSQHALMWMLEQNPALQKIALCLDNDAAGVKATARLTESLQEKGYEQIGVLTPKHKDWNEDLTSDEPTVENEVTMTM